MKEPSPPPDQQENARFLAQGMRYFGVVTQFVATLVILGFVGNRLDTKYGWSPWGTLVGIGLAMSVGVWSLLRQVQKLETIDRKK